MSNPNGLEGRILILGDETKSARAIERLLAASGYTAHYLTSFEAARQQVISQDIALVIIEPSASRLNGNPYEPSADDSGDGLRRIEWARDALHFCEETKSNKPTSELPILVISKSQRTQDKVACLNRGVTDYLTRPYQRAELLSRVRSHVRAWRNERERTERFEQLNVFHAVSSVLTSSLEPDVLLEGTLSVLVNHLSVDAGVVYLRNADTLQMSIVAAEGFHTGEDGHAGLLDLHSRIAPLMNGHPLVLEPLPDSAKKGIAGDMIADFHGLVCAPIGLKGNIIGAICLFSNKESAFQRQQSDLLSTICNQLSVAIENARLYVETKKSAAQLSFVYNLGNNLMTSLEMDELLGYAVFSVGKSVACDVCAVVVRGSGEDEQLVSAIYSPHQSEKQSHIEWFDEDRVNRYIESADYGVHPAVEIRVVERFLRDSSVVIEMSVPLMFDDRLLGVLICGSCSSRTISADDQKLLGAVAQQLSLAIRNTELYKRTKDTSINLAVEVSRRTREAEEQKRFIEKIIDSLPVSLYVVDRDMRIVAWNRNRELGGSGISRDEVLGKNVFKVLSRQPRRLLEDEFVDVFRSGDMAAWNRSPGTKASGRFGRSARFLCALITLRSLTSSPSAKT